MPPKTERADKKEVEAIVLDFLQWGYADDKRPLNQREPVILAVGTDQFKLLELIPKRNYAINLHVGAQHSARHSLSFLGSTEINPYTDLLKLLQRLRDESHRFAITYHQSLKQRRQTSSKLEDIPGIGPATRRKLLRHFGSVARVKEASEQELASVVGPKLAQSIKKAVL